LLFSEKIKRKVEAFWLLRSYFPKKHLKPIKRQMKRFRRQLFSNYTKKKIAKLTKKDKSLLSQFKFSQKITSQFTGRIAKCFLGSLMKCGKKQRAHKIFLSLLHGLEQRFKKNPLYLLASFIFALKPRVSLWAKKRGGSTYNLPYIITENRAISIAVHWIITEAKLRKERTFANRLIKLISDSIVRRTYVLIRKRNYIHAQAFYNRGYLHMK
jgi:small subunit ribosomal protein S7